MQKCMQYDRSVDRKKQSGTEKGQCKPTLKSSQAEARGSAETQLVPAVDVATQAHTESALPPIKNT